MSNIIYLPSSDLLSHAINDINREVNLEKRNKLRFTLAERVLEHSNEIKRMIHYAE